MTLLMELPLFTQRKNSRLQILTYDFTDNRCLFDLPVFQCLSGVGAWIIINFLMTRKTEPDSIGDTSEIFSFLSIF